jgi:hypothetical protein
VAVVVQGILLELRVVAEIYGSLRLGHRDAVAARERLRDTGGRGRLIVPLREVAHRIALHVGRMDPIDARPPLGFVHGPGGPQDQDRRAVDVRVVDGHGGVEQADDVVQDGGHGAPGGFGEAVGDADRDLLVLGEDELGLDVAAVIDERVV